MNVCDRVPDSIYPSVPRIVVIGDIHGDWYALQDCLKLAKVINPRGNWVGGSTYVIQLGDILDRGCRASYCSDENSEFKILNYFEKLHQQAREKKGAVLVLLGNHEIMNVMGDFRYVSSQGFKHFGSTEKRKQAFKPGGYWAHYLACHTNSVIQIGSWIFSHTGILPNITYKYPITKINHMVRQFLLGNSDLKNKSDLLHFFWHREYGYSRNNIQCKKVDRALSNLKGRGMVIGHTPQISGINNDCQGKLWRIDTGMSGAYGPRTVENKYRRIQVLEILNDGKKINVLSSHF